MPEGTLGIKKCSHPKCGNPAQLEGDYCAHCIQLPLDFCTRCNFGADDPEQSKIDDEVLLKQILERYNQPSLQTKMKPWLYFMLGVVVALLLEIVIIKVVSQSDKMSAQIVVIFIGMVVVVYLYEKWYKVGTKLKDIKE